MGKPEPDKCRIEHSKFFTQAVSIAELKFGAIDQPTTRDFEHLGIDVDADNAVSGLQDALRPGAGAARNVENTLTRKELGYKTAEVS